MADVTLNFSSRWKSIQVTQVIDQPYTKGEAVSMPKMARKIEHGLDYPPLAIVMSSHSHPSVFDIMTVSSVDEKYVYLQYVSEFYPAPDCLVIYAVDISKAASYKNYERAYGETIKDTSATKLDMRKLLLHSRAVSPMLLEVANKTFTPNDNTLTHTHTLGYPTFCFGYVHWSSDEPNTNLNGIWEAAPLGGQAYPLTQSNGYTSTVEALNNPNAITDKGSIVVLRNPAIITNNTVSVTL